MDKLKVVSLPVLLRIVSLLTLVTAALSFTFSDIASQIPNVFVATSVLGAGIVVFILPLFPQKNLQMAGAAGIVFFGLNIIGTLCSNLFHGDQTQYYFVGGWRTLDTLLILLASIIATIFIVTSSRGTATLMQRVPLVIVIAVAVLVQFIKTVPGDDGVASWSFASISAGAIAVGVACAVLFFSDLSKSLFVVIWYSALFAMANLTPVRRYLGNGIGDSYDTPKPNSIVLVQFVLWVALFTYSLYLVHATAEETQVVAKPETPIVEKSEA